MEIVKVAAHRAWSFDIRYGEWNYWTANDDPHPDPWRGKFDKYGVLLVFDSEEERIKALEAIKGHLQC